MKFLPRFNNFSFSDWIAIVMCFVVISLSILNKRGYGSIRLEHVPMDKILEKFDVMLIKFDEGDPQGPKHETFKIVENKSIPHSNCLVAEVLMTDQAFEDERNHDLLKKINIIKEDFPEYRLFKRNITEPVVFNGNKKSPEQILAFVLRETGLWLGEAGSIKEFDDLVESFIKSPKDNRKSILKEALDEEKESKHKDLSDDAQTYVKIMSKIQETGIQFLTNEIKRVNKLLSGKLSSSKRDQLKRRSKIMNVFKIRALEAGIPLDDHDDDDELLNDDRFKEL